MQDELQGRLWEAHHEEFSAAVDAALRRAASRLRNVPWLAERVAGQVLVAVAAAGIASTLTLSAGLA